MRGCTKDGAAASARLPLENSRVLRYASFEPDEKGVPAAAGRQHVLVVNVGPRHIALTPVNPAGDVVKGHARRHAYADRGAADGMTGD